MKRMKLVRLVQIFDVEELQQGECCVNIDLYTPGKVSDVVTVKPECLQGSFIGKYLIRDIIQ